MVEPGAASDHDRRTARAVFISYATADRKEALSICKAIERRGTKCWISTRDVAPGENYQEEIVRAIRNSRAMVLVFSEAANNSDEIKKELSLASRHHVPVMALRIEDVEPSDAFAYELSTRQWIDAYAGWDKSIDALLRKIGQVDGAPAAPTVVHAPRLGLRASTTTVRTMLIGALGVLLTAVTVAGWFLMRPSGAAAHTMQVRLAGFQRLSPDLPASMPQALADEVNASFNKDGVVTVSTAAAPPPGNSPAYAMNGTIRREGDKIKVIVRLTNERSGITLWSNDYTYDAALIARVPHLAAVESSMVVRCGLFGASTYSKPLPDNVLVPYLGYCQGTDGPEAPKALNFAQKAVALAPDFSWGWSGVAVAAAGSWLDGGGTDENLHRQALDSADRAIELDPSNSEAYSYKAILIDRNDLTGQEKLFRKALAARPLACGCEHHLYAVFLFGTGRIRDAIAEFRHGITVLPLSGSTQVSLGNALLYTGDVDGANAAFDAAADLDPDVSARRQLAVQVAPFDRDFAGAATIVFDPKVPEPKVFRDAIGGGFAALASGSADAKMKAVERLAAAPLMNADVQLSLLALLGAPKIALQKIDGSANQGMGYYRGMLWLPSMRSTLRDPSFSAMAERLGLMRYWKTTHTRPDACSTPDPPPFCRMI